MRRPLLHSLLYLPSPTIPGTPSEDGTYRDARAALAWILEQPDVEPSRVLYLGESLGGAIALRLALEHPPAGLVPDAYPSLEQISELDAPLLVLHGERDEIVPVAHGRALFEAAPEPKRLRAFPELGHNDLVPRA